MVFSVACMSSGAASTDKPGNAIVEKTGIATIQPTSTTIPPTFTPSPTATPSFVSGIMYLQIYGMPDLAYAIRDDIRGEETFKVLGRTEDGSFLEIEFDDQIGWVEAISVVASPATAIQNLPVVEYEGHPAEMAGWKGTPIKTLCLDTQAKFVGNYSRANPNDVPTPYSEKVLRAILKYIDVELVPVGQACDATLHFDYVIDQIGRSYINQTTRETAFCYTGMSLTNRWTLTQGEIISKGEEKSKRSAQETMFGCWPSSPYQDEQHYTAFAVIQKFWGDAIFPPLAEIIEPAANRYLINYAAKLGKKGTAFLPYLIEFSDDFIVGDEAQEALKKVTGEQFWDDKAAWLEWYMAHPTATPKP